MGFRGFSEFGKVLLEEFPNSGAKSSKRVSLKVPIPFVPSAAGEWVKISVRDTGIGLKAEDLERVFAPFEQADNSVSRKYQGTGLGLSLTKRLVELHGGKIWAESGGEGKGSKFTFVLAVEHGHPLPK